MKRSIAVRPVLEIERFKVVDVPDDLFGAILTIEDPAVPHATPKFSDGVRKLARARLKSMTAVIRPVTKDELDLWLEPIMVAGANPRPAEQIPAWFEAVFLCVAGAPRGVFTVQKQQRALRELKFFPTPADIWALVADEVESILRHAETLTRIIGEERP